VVSAFSRLLPQRGVYRYVSVVSAVGLALLFAGAASWEPHWQGGRGAQVLLLTLGLIVGELLPVSIPRREGEEQITFSTTFAFALLLLGGVAPAVITMTIASLLQDSLTHKPWWRIIFNVAQYTLAIGAAAGVLELAAYAPGPPGHAFAAGDLPEIVIAGAAFFIVNYLVVGVAVALYARVRVGEYLRSEFGFSALTGAVLLALGPIVLAAIQYAPDLFPFFLFPLAAIYRGSRAAAQREHDATHDGLTGLPNRRAFRESAERSLQHEEDCRASVILLNLNRFREINDTLGHYHGDRLLRMVGERLAAALPEEAVLARFSGDEFGVFAPGVYGDAEVEAAVSPLLDAFERPFELDAITLEVDATVGVARHPRDATAISQLVQYADVAMYHAKQNHLPYAAYSRSVDHHSSARLALAGDLRRALDADDQIVLDYQPKLDIQAGRVTGVEALARWKHPALGLIPPASFIPVAERTGLIKVLTLRVLDVALGQQRRWLEQGIELDVAVNISARSLLDPDFPGQVAAALERHAPAPATVTLEITESMIMSDPALAHRTLVALSELGLRLSIDDFGTGYSSLSYLNELPVDEVKIDRSFVTGLRPGSNGELIVRTVVDLARNLGLSVVAEGVEAAGELEHLEALGCRTAQGYFISPPVDADGLAAWFVLRPAGGRVRAAR
jgi:diguanylate cyclase (GGDEF)-like protein